jgi:ribosomal protein S18
MSTEIPDDFYDEAKEADMELLDVAASVTTGDLRDILNVEDSKDWSFLDDFVDGDAEKKILKSRRDRFLAMQKLDNIPWEDLDGNSSMAKELQGQNGNSEEEDEASALAEFMDSELDELDEEDEDDSSSVDEESELMSNFLSVDDPESDYAADEQDARPCPGKLQRKGKSGVLLCHKLDLDALTHLDVMTLRNYLTVDSEIMSRKKTGLCARCQRKVAKTIKRARNFGIVPHLGHYEMQPAGVPRAGKSLPRWESVEPSKAILRR